jgi:hypothetical protein
MGKGGEKKNEKRGEKVGKGGPENVEPKRKASKLTI